MWHSKGGTWVWFDCTCPNQHLHALSVYIPKQIHSFSKALSRLGKVLLFFKNILANMFKLSTVKNVLAPSREFNFFFLSSTYLNVFANTLKNRVSCFSLDKSSFNRWNRLQMGIFFKLLTARIYAHINDNITVSVCTSLCYFSCTSYNLDPGLTAGWKYKLLTAGKKNY